ncbi:MAG: hypothetical protein PUC15_01910 [Lentisphaeria bacterium]|nr:hypothetical protein [Lentisphaeria bacterium]
MDQKDNAGRFERGCLKVTTDNLASWTWSGREKPPNTKFVEVPINIPPIFFSSSDSVIFAPVFRVSALPAGFFFEKSAYFALFRSLFFILAIY